MQEKIEKGHKEITHIQNTIWGMYKAYLSDHDMKKWNDGMGKLTQEYTDKGDEQLLMFVQWSLITWCPIISGFAEEFNKGEGYEDSKQVISSSE